MGYYTKYTLKGAGPSENEHDLVTTDKFRAAVTAVSDYKEPFGEEHKWYGHEEDVARAMIDTGTGNVLIYGLGEDHDSDEWFKSFTLDPVTMQVSVRTGRIIVTKTLDWDKPEFARVVGPSKQRPAT